MSPANTVSAIDLALFAVTGWKPEHYRRPLLFSNWIQHAASSAEAQLQPKDET
jgi:hypothetical protein